MFKFLYAYFPVDQFSILLGVSLLPILVSTFLIQVFFGLIIGGNDAVYDYDFVPVNIGFAIACVAAFYQLAYHIYLGKTLINAEENKVLQSGESDTWIKTI